MKPIILNNKNIFFFIGLPRSGNTLLASLVNQSKELTLTANSITPTILFAIEKIKKEFSYKNFPDETSINNVLKNALFSYYNEWKTDNILDRGPWGTPENLNIIYKINPNPKFVVLYRPLKECVASFVKKENPVDKKKYVNYLLNDTEHILSKNLWSIHNLLRNNIPFYLITYDDLVNNTKETLNNLFKYLNLKTPSIDLNKLEQLNINNVIYENDNDMHKIRTNEIKKIKYDVSNYLSIDLINVCEQYEPKIINK
jgi:hypothetical protein